MNAFSLGYWGTVDESLQWIGRGAARLLTRRIRTPEENVLIGGALLCAVFGAVVGFAFSEISQSVTTTGGIIIGVLLGVCSGIFLGSFVEAIDGTIKNVLASLKSK
ncbi:MAG TPA: hypothetical protein VGF82_20705 [Terracidiphilus sp.]|jgi:uncharacterized membrane protein required for colicin V production